MYSFQRHSFVLGIGATFLRTTAIRQKNCGMEMEEDRWPEGSKDPTEGRRPSQKRGEGVLPKADRTAAFGNANNKTK